MSADNLLLLDNDFKIRFCNTANWLSGHQTTCSACLAYMTNGDGDLCPGAKAGIAFNMFPDHTEINPHCYDHPRTITAIRTMIPEPKEEYECPHCGEPFSIEPDAERYICKVCNYGLTVSRDAEFVDGVWRNRTKVSSPPISAEPISNEELERIKAMCEDEDAMLKECKSDMSDIVSFSAEALVAIPKCVAEIERLKGEVNGLLDKFLEINRESLTKITRLQTELAEARKDKERLDWLEKQEGLTTCGFRFKWFAEDGISIREAIDAAMKATPQ